MNQEIENLLQTISNVLHANSENIQNNDYMLALNALMQVYNLLQHEEPDEEEDPIQQYLCTSNVPQENRITYAMFFILNRASTANIIGCSGCDIMLCQNECKLSYSEIKHELVPALQAEGFDVNLSYTEDNQFNEEHFNNDGLLVEWEECNSTSSYMTHKLEGFPKTTDEYHRF